jgi:hypothetical protein
MSSLVVLPQVQPTQSFDNHPDVLESSPERRGTLDPGNGH